jgi:hypothetical protein
MAKHAFRDPTTGVLKCVGFVERNEPGDIKMVVPDEFALEPGKWKWDGTAWVPFAPDDPNEPRRKAIKDAADDEKLPSTVRKAFDALWRSMR